jgi:competence/damage-inducible protein CinA-like protein
MPSAEIITIGTEILLGEIVDTNARYLARGLRDAGIDLYRKTTVGDNLQRIARAIQQSLERCDIVLTTGGLGPTVDDPTRAAVALAFQVENEFRPELWEQIQARFRRFNRQPTENNKRQAYMPKGAVAIENPVGTAPSFIFDTGRQVVISLPGVPSEMEYLMEHAVLPFLLRRFQIKSFIKSRIIHTAGAGESQIDDLIGDLEQLINPTVGLAAHSGQVDVRITAKAESETAANELIQPIEDAVRQRLGAWVYGADQETLEEVVQRNLARLGWSLVVVEAGLSGHLIRRLSLLAGVFLGGEALAALPDPAELAIAAERFRAGHAADVALAVAIQPAGERQEVYFCLITPTGRQQFNRPYGGPPEYASRWALHHALDILRNL